MGPGIEGEMTESMLFDGEDVDSESHSDVVALAESFGWWDRCGALGSIGNAIMMEISKYL